MSSIKILYISDFRFYLYSPKTWLHVKFQKNKIVFFLICMFIIPYIDMILLLTFCIFYVILLAILNLPKKIIKYIIQRILGYILIFMLLNINYSNVCKKASCDSIFFTRIPIYRILKKRKTVPYSEQKNYIQIQLSIPKFVVRSILIISTYLISINLLSLTTKHEEIIMFFVFLSSETFSYLAKEIMFMSLLATLSLNLVFNKFTKIIIGNKIRGRNIYDNVRMINRIKMYYFIVLYLLLYFYNQTLSLSYSLYVRDIKMYYFS